MFYVGVGCVFWVWGLGGVEVGDALVGDLAWLLLLVHN